MLKRWLAVSLLVYFAMHFLIVLVAANFNFEEILQRFYYLDSKWYKHIALHGYQVFSEVSEKLEVAFAFFPLWPLVLRVCSYFFPDVWPLQVQGAFLAAGFFIAFLYLVCTRAKSSVDGLVPKTGLGLFCLIFSPGSWVFCSNHTESLFLFLSWGSLFLAYQNKSQNSWLWASMLAGLSALTRNQGVLLAITTAYVLALSMPIHVPVSKKFKRFICSGLISGSIFFLWLIFQWWKTGNVLLSVTTQSNWSVAHNFSEYLTNLFWVSGTNFFRILIFWYAMVLSMMLFRQHRLSRPLGFYIFMSIILWPMQGWQFPQAYRFGAVLFPLWFILGDNLSKVCERFALSKFLKASVVVIALLWSGVISTFYYFQTLWPY